MLVLDRFQSGAKIQSALAWVNAEDAEFAEKSNDARMQSGGDGFVPAN